MTAWKRLRIIEVSPETDAEKLLRLAGKLDAGDALTEDDRHATAAYLRRLASGRRALAALTRSPRGRPRNSIYPHVALDYLAQRELRGARRWKAAQADVAAAWKLKAPTVADAWTTWQNYARWKLASLLGGHRGGSNRRQLLSDISADLREIHGTRAREK